MTNWQDWYFERAKQRASQEAHDLFFNEIKPGCSNKMLAQIARGVLDIGDPTVVDWRFLRPAHVFLKQDVLDKRTTAAAMSNIKRIVAKGAQRRLKPWFLEQMGWERKTDNNPNQISILGEDEYKAIENSAVGGLPNDLATGIRAMMRLMYYGGLTPSQVRVLKSDDITLIDGRMLVYAGGLLMELPDHVRLPLAAWTRMRAEKKQRGRKTKTDGTGRVFRSDQARVVAKFPRLPDTFRSLRRLRG